MKTIFEDYKSTGGLTIGALKELLKNYPEDMMITVRTLNEHFPARTIVEGVYNIYPLTCNGIAQGKKKCLRIE